MSAPPSTSIATEQVAALFLADALMSGFASQRAGHQRRATRPEPAGRVAR
jgi:hypothetical protein